jgi:methionyl-tRNA synthetase
MSELVNDHCPLHPTTELEVIEEENYFFRWSKYQQPLLDLYKNQPDFVVPDFRLNEIRTFVEGGLEDFSISRLKEKLPWGVPVPGDASQVMYVWFDALVNYISTLGWPDGAEYKTYWPVVQVAGKDNLRQQSAMWQAMLMSAGLPASKQIFIHGFLTVEGKKISKSVGNVIDPLEVVNQYGTDALRYYLLRHIPSAEDGDFSWERLEQAYNSELADDLGNLVFRTASMVSRYQDGAIGQVPEAEHDVSRYHEALENFQFDRALETVWEQIHSLNQYIEEEKPWELAKEDKDHLSEVLGYLVGSLLQIAQLLSPFLPATAQLIKEGFKDGVVSHELKPLFPKIYRYTPNPKAQ